MSPTAYAHFIGIGGAGMSGLARVLHDRGLAVTGSDLKESRYARALAEAGVTVFIGHDPANLGEPEVVVTSAAIPESNPELTEARRRGIPVWPRARMLAEIARGSLTLAVAGTHGKTTTSSMLAAALDGVGEAPTFLIGGELNDMGANARSGTGRFCVVEADESDGSFLHLSPHLAIVTNVDADHLDHYGSFDAILETFGDFISKVDPSGTVVVCGDDPRLVALATERARARVVTYGRGDGAHVRCERLTHEGTGYRFVVTFPDSQASQAHLSVPGVHNAVNATGVLAAVWSLGLPIGPATDALARFSGVRRRFERVGEVGGVVVVDDYGHHPTEVKATLAAARDAGYRRVWVVFQPHRYTRTQALGAEFGGAFADADHVVLMDVYSAGETPIPGVSGKTVLDAVLHTAPRTQAAYFPHRHDVGRYVCERVRPGDLVMTMGAGDVTTVSGEIVRGLAAREEAGTPCR